MTVPSVTPSQVRSMLLLRDEIALLDLRHEAAFATGHPLFAANMAADRIALEAETRLPRKDVPIVVYDAGLHTRQLEISTGVCEGIATAREGHDLVVYGTDRETGTISRWIIQEKDGAVVSATQKGFDGPGEFKVPGATDLRGVKVDAKGNIWVADLKGGKVVCAGIHMSDIPSFPYDLLWEERQLVSVANLTRQDGLDFLRVDRKSVV